LGACPGQKIGTIFCPKGSLAVKSTDLFVSATKEKLNRFNQTIVKYVGSNIIAMIGNYFGKMLSLRKIIQ
jgi:hypothetical protein